MEQDFSLKPDEARIEEIFEKKLQLKFTWSKDEVIEAYRESKEEAIYELIDKIQNSMIINNFCIVPAS